jgi:hypothetical protein
MLTNNLLRLLCWCLLACAASPTVHAQDADPFAPAPGQPAAAPAAPAPRKPAAEPNLSITAQIILSENPKTLVELARAIDTLIQLKEIEAAKPLVKKLVALKPDLPTQVDAVRKLNTSLWLRLAQSTEFPEVQKFAENILSTTSKFARDPARLKKFTTDLVSAQTEEQQANALLGLLGAGDAGIAACLGALANPALNAQGRARLAEVVNAGQRSAIEPVLATLQNSSPELRSSALMLLGQVAGSDAVPWLLTPALIGKPDSLSIAAQAALNRLGIEAIGTEQAIPRIRREVNSYLNDERRLLRNSDDLVSLWSWDAKAKEPVATWVPQQVFQATRAAQLSEDLIQLDPNSTESQQLWLRSQLRYAALSAGLHRVANLTPAQLELVKKLPAGSLEQFLDNAIKAHDPITAAAVIRLWPQVRPMDTLHGPQLHPVVQALRYPDRRMQYAAAQALTQLNPEQPYTGMGHLVETLKYLSTCRGQRMGIAAFPNAETATILAGFLSNSGITGIPVTNGRQAVLAAQQHADCELVMLSTRLNREPLAFTLQDLQRDPRTANLSILILCEDRAEELRLSAQYANDSRISVFLRPYDQSTVDFLVKRMQQQRGIAWVTAAERAEQGLFTLQAMQRLQSTRPKSFQFQEVIPAIVSSMDDAALTSAAATLLAEMNHHTAQLALVEFLNRREVPIKQRNQALEQFQATINRHGVLLTRNEVLQQYTVYNASATADAETQRILNTVLDLLESRGKAVATSKNP